MWQKWNSLTYLCIKLTKFRQIKIPINHDHRHLIRGNSCNIKTRKLRLSIELSPKFEKSFMANRENSSVWKLQQNRFMRGNKVSCLTSL